MTRKECDYLLKILHRIKPQDEHTQLAILYVSKQIAIYDAQRGQMKENYDSDFGF